MLCNVIIKAFWCSTGIFDATKPKKSIRRQSSLHCCHEYNLPRGLSHHSLSESPLRQNCTSLSSLLIHNHNEQQIACVNHLSPKKTSNAFAKQTSQAVGNACEMLDGVAFGDISKKSPIRDLWNNSRYNLLSVLHAPHHDTPQVNGPSQHKPQHRPIASRHD